MMNELKDDAIAELNGRTFDKLEMEGDTIDSKEFYDCHFIQCNFRNTQLINCTFRDCTFEYCDLSLAKPEKSHFQDIRFEKSKMVGIDWSLASLQKSKLNYRLSFLHSDISFSLFLNLNCKGISIVECKAKEVDFTEADLSNAILTKTDFEGATFFNTNLDNADFSHAINYMINICNNKVKNARFSFPEVLNLLKSHQIIIEDFTLNT
jgi:uncharacterized protein YjbI with pentapeptide repeats